MYPNFLWSLWSSCRLSPAVVKAKGGLNYGPFVKTVVTYKAQLIKKSLSKQADLCGDIFRVPDRV